MRILIVFLMVVGASAVWADVAVIREFAPETGRAGEMLQTAAQARAIHEKLGASVYVGTDQSGNVHYALSFADWAAWAKFDAAVGKSKEWNDFMQNVGANPPGEMVNVLFLNVPVVPKTTPVTIVYGWDVTPGMTDAFMALAQEAAAIHTKLGASPGISIDDLGNVWYEIGFDSWAAWAAFDAAQQKSAEWEAFFTKAGQVGAGELIRVIRIEQAPQS